MLPLLWTLQNAFAAFEYPANRLMKRKRKTRRHERSNQNTMSRMVEQAEARLLLTTAAAGDQFLVAEAAGFTATPPTTAVQSSGAFTGVWESFEEDGSGFGIFAQRFDAAGTPLAPANFQVNSYVAGEQSASAIAGDEAGNVLIVWQSKGQDDVDVSFGIYGQWYDSLGAAIGTEFLVNTTTAGDQKAPTVAMDESGNTVVAWQSDGQDGDDWGIYYTRFDSVGDTAGTELRANVATIGRQQAPTVAAAANGNFVIAWEAVDPAGGSDASLDIYARVYDGVGTEIAAESRVNTDMVRDQVTPQAAMDANGAFAIVWVGGGIPGSGSDVFGQRFDQLGAPQGAQFRVNNTTLASQVGGVVSMDNAGNFLVTWQSVHQDGFSEGIFGRQYDAAGNTVIDEFLVNTVVEGPQSAPSVSMNNSGQTVVTWRGKNADHQSAVFGQRYKIPNGNAALFKVGDEFQLGTLVELEGNPASAAMDLAGNSVVVWEAYERDGDGLGVYGQLLDTFGDPIGPSFLVNSGFTTGHQGAPTVARAADGRFVVAWHSNDHDGDGYGIFAQLYDATGAPVGSEFQVNTTVAGDQASPTAAMGDDGRFVIAWQGSAGDGTTNIYAQRFDSSGTAAGSEFQVNNFTALDQIMPAVTMNAAGQFAIAWVSSHPAATIPELDPEKSVFVQWYDAAGVSTGDEVLAHNYVKDAQESPSLGMDAAGKFVIAWQSISQDGSTWGVYARQFLADKTPVQADEFLVNETTDQLQRLAGVGVRADGSFVIAWESTSLAVDDGSSTDIYRREYFADGTSDGHENLVNTWTGGPQVSPVVARTTTGNYGIFWMGQGFSHIDGVHGRLYDVNLLDDPGTPSRLPAGGQFMVGATLGFENSSPALAMNTDGTFTVAFESFEEDGSGFGIFTQRFNANGTAIDGSRIQVNSTTLDDQSSPAIATDGLGNVLIVWQSKDSNGYGVFGQWFDPTGAKSGGEFQLNTEVIGDQSKPDVAMDSTGRAAVTWQSAGQDGAGQGVYYVRLNAIGATSGTELRANETTAGDQQAPSVAVAAVDGQFVIVWQGPGPLVEGEASVEVFGRRFSGLDATPGSEFQVNSNPAKDQTLPDVAMDSSGDAVIVWQAEGQQGSGSDIFGRRMDDTGTLLGTDALINATTTRPQRSPAVSMNGDGNFLVAWQSQHQDGYSWGIYGHEYDASGATVVGEFAINERVAGPQTSPGVAVNQSGQALVAWLGNDANHHPAVSGHRYLIPNTEPAFSVGTELVLVNYVGLEEMPPAAAMNANRETVVAWVSYAEDGSGLGVFGQMLDRNGAAIGSRFAVNAFTAGNQGLPAVARAQSGEFVIAWDSEAEDGDGYGVYARRYAADGTPVGSIFQVNSTTPGDQTRPAVAMAADGSFVIVWQTVSIDGSTDIMAQRYQADGTANGSEILINTFTDLDQKDAAIAMNAAGAFVIAWVSDHPAVTSLVDTEKSIFVQSFDSNGQSTGPEVLVHRYVKDGQEAPAVGIDASGRFVVGWQSINQDGNSWGVFARRFENDKTPVDRSEFVVNESRQGPQRYVGVGMDSYGRFVITWQTNSQAELAGGGNTGGGDGADGSSWDIYSRQYGFDGRHEGGELIVNQWKQGPQVLPVVAQAPNGDFGIFWLGQGPDHTEGVHGRLYQNAVGTVGDDAFVLTYEGTAPTGSVTVTVSTNGGPVISLGTFQLTLPLTLDGLGGNDSIRVVGTSDADSLTVNTSSELTVNGASLILTSIENRTLSGAAGNDVYKFDADTALGLWVLDEAGGGIDTVDFSLTTTVGLSLNMATAGTQSVHATNLSLVLGSDVTIENAVGGDGADMLFGNSLDNTLAGGAGDDKLIGAAGNDWLIGGTNNDTYVFVPASGPEADRVTETLNEGIDTLSFAYLTTDVVVNLGSTSIQPVHTDRTLKLNSSAVLENIIGGTGADTLFGNSLDNTLIGGAGDDKLIGAAGNDLLIGGTNNDTYVFVPASSPEADLVTERIDEGTDALSFAYLTTDVMLGLETSLVQSVHVNRTLKLNAASVFEVIVGGSGNDTLTGNSLANTLTGNAGNDKLTGNGGDDSLFGGSGDDTYVFGTATTPEADIVAEATSAGTDTISFSYLTTDVILSLETTDVQTVHANRTLKLNAASVFENIAGGSGNDTLTGNSLSNILVGNAGDDTLNGGGGGDILIGGLGLDTLNGGEDEDILIAGFTTSDSLFSDLNVLLVEWVSVNSYATRISNLRAGVGAPAVSLKATVNVLNDAGEFDSLVGGNGTDWYFRALDDVVTGLATDEVLDIL